MNAVPYAAAALVLAGAFLCIWMVFIEPRRFRLWRVAVPRVAERTGEEVSVSAQRLPALTILHISDTHFGGRDGAKLGFLRRAAQEPCDLVLLTGDLLDSPLGLSSCLELAELLEPRLGSYAVLGGHDYFLSAELWRNYSSLAAGSPPPEKDRRPNPVAELKAGLAERGVEVLEDESRTVRLPDGRELAIVGLRDAFVFEPDLDAAWSHVPVGAPSIVLAHSPDVLGEVVHRGADLAFFGHTHGGQVRLPLVGAVVTRSRIARRRARGVFREGRTVFTINNGLGAGRGASFRLLCPPEITVMHLL